MTKENIFAVDIGGSKLICGILTPRGEILDTYHAEYAPGYTPEMLLELIREGFVRLNGASCVACGAAIPGLCDSEHGVWLYSPFSGISDIPVGKLLSEITGLPSYTDNDVNVSALAERYFGVCRETDDFLWITVSNGIGGGLFLNGKLYRGARMTAGEIGHIVVEESGGRTCGCGNRGCLEAMASGASISEIYRLRTGKTASAKELSLLARNGDTEAIRVFGEAGAYIGKAAAHAVNLLGIGTVVLGGGVAESFDLLEPSLRRALDKFVFLRANPRVEVLHSAPGRYAALLGCAALVLDQKC